HRRRLGIGTAGVTVGLQHLEQAGLAVDYRLERGDRVDRHGLEAVVLEHQRVEGVVEVGPLLDPVDGHVRALTHRGRPAVHVEQEDVGSGPDQVGLASARRSIEQGLQVGRAALRVIEAVEDRAWLALYRLRTERITHANVLTSLYSRSSGSLSL